MTKERILYAIPEQGPPLERQALEQFAVLAAGLVITISDHNLRAGIFSDAFEYLIERRLVGNSMLPTYDQIARFQQS